MWQREEPPKSEADLPLRQSREVSLTKFLDFLVAKNPGQRQTKAREIAEQMSTPYRPGLDMYKDAREAIQVARGKKIRLNADLLPAPKGPHYAAIETGWNRFVGRKQFTPERVRRKTWTSEGLTVLVNPEIALRRNGRVDFLKLYFKAEDLTKGQAEIAHQMLYEMLVDLPESEGIGIVDVRKGRLVTPPAVLPDAGIAYQLRAEAAYLLRLLEQHLS